MVKNDTQIRCFALCSKSALLQFRVMMRWIGVLVALPYFSFSQTSSNQLVIPLHAAVYQAKESSTLGLSKLPALQGSQRNTKLGISIENKYNLKELAALNFGIGVPTQHGSFGLFAGLQGSLLHTDYNIGLNYGHQLNDKITMGIGFNLAETYLKENRKTSYAGIIAGIAYCINEKTTLAIHYQNQQDLTLSNNKFETKEEGLSIGIGHQLSKTIFVQTEIQKPSNRLHVLPSIIWTVHEKIELWSGINRSGHLYLGINNKIKKSIVGIGMASHPQLGYSISIQLNHSFNEKN